MTRNLSDSVDVGELRPLQRYIVQLLQQRRASYAHPVRSREIASVLNICETYAREQARILVVRGIIRVRPGPRGGYYLEPSVPILPEPSGAQGSEPPPGAFALPPQGPTRPPALRELLAAYRERAR